MNSHRRYWLLTWTVYGSWLPGDARGSVTRVRDGVPERSPRIERDAPETPYVDAIPELVDSVRRRMKGEALVLSVEQATVIARTMEGVCRHRRWELLAGSVMSNHVHVVVAAREAIDSTFVLRDLKSYSARAMNERWNRPASGTWWTQSGSRRPLRDETAIGAACEYVRKQSFVLARCEPIIIRDTN